jgi:hypothetical protein
MRQPQRELPLRVVSAKPKIRRRVFRVQIEPAADGTYIFTAHSFTKQRRSYTCLVNPSTRQVHCTCRDFARLLPAPTYLTGRLCKHLDRAVRTVRRVIHREKRLVA